MYNGLLNASTKLETKEAVERWLENLTHDNRNVGITYHAPRWVDVEPRAVEFQRFTFDKLSVNCNKGTYRVSFRSSFPDVVSVDGRVESDVDGVASSIVCKGTISTNQDGLSGDVKVLVCPIKSGDA